MDTTTPHPLVQKQLQTLSWATWKQAWETTNSPEVLLGLLHVALDVPTGGRNDEGRERICFLLDIADGYRCTRTLRGDERESWDAYRFDSAFGRMIWPEIRREVATKAFKVLCDGFFKDQSERNSETPSWFHYITEYEEVFHKILWFFSDTERRMFNSESNLPDAKSESHHNQLAVTFVRELIERTWTLRTFGVNRDSTSFIFKEMAAKFIAARPQYVDLLYRLGDLNFLLRRFKEVDGPSRKKLLDIALVHRMGGDKKYKTVEEAAHDGNSAARIYIVLRSLREEEDRQKKIRDAEYKRQEAEANLRQARQR